MFGWFKRKTQSASDAGGIGTQVPGEIFAWPKGAVLTALDEVVVAIPIALLEADRPLAESVFAPDDMEINIPQSGDKFYVRMRPGMSLTLGKSVQACIVADDKRPRRFPVKPPPSRPGADHGENSTPA